MARGGYRPGAGRPKGSKELGKKAPLEGGVPADVVRAAIGAGLTPLEYMLKVMNNVDADQSRRDRMAVAAAPFVHARADAVQEGKRAQRQANAEHAAKHGPFAVPPAPKALTH